jgi:hypothetical protein
MGLIKYYGKKVRIIAKNGKMFEGRVTDYYYPEDNEPEEESIAIRCEKGSFVGKSIEFREHDIVTIEVMN